jgi:predicted RNase H-like HicB family nuclease
MDRGRAVRYTVQSVWDPSGVWVTTVPDVPGAITQSKRLDLVAGDVAEAISLMTDLEVSSDDIHVEWSAPADVEAAAQTTKGLRERAASLAEEAHSQTVATLRQLYDRGFSVRDAGALVGVSHQYAARVIKRDRRRAG